MCPETSDMRFETCTKNRISVQKSESESVPHPSQPSTFRKAVGLEPIQLCSLVLFSFMFAFSLRLMEGGLTGQRPRP